METLNTTEGKAASFKKKKKSNPKKINNFKIRKSEYGKFPLF